MSRCLSLSLSLSLALCLCLSFSHSLSLSLCLSLSVSVSRSLALSLSLSLALALCLCLSFSRSVSLSVSLCLSRSPSRSLFLSFSFSLALSLALYRSPLAPSHTHTRAQYARMHIKALCCSGAVEQQMLPQLSGLCWHTCGPSDSSARPRRGIRMSNASLLPWIPVHYYIIKEVLSSCSHHASWFSLTSPFRLAVIRANQL